MSDWHVWASTRLYDVADGLSDGDYRRDVGLFFKSVHGTLNHLLLVERMWRGRLTGRTIEMKSLGDEIERDRSKLRTTAGKSRRRSRSSDRGLPRWTIRIS